MSPGGRRLDECTRVKEGCLMRQYQFHGSEISWNCLFKMNFHPDEPWRTEVGWVYEGEGGLSYETITSMDRKSHETFCLQWTFTQISPGGQRLTCVRGWRRAVLWDNNFHGWKKISWNCLFTMNFHSDEPWGTEVRRVYEGEGRLSYETITSMDEKKSHETVCLQWIFTQMSPGGRRLDECTRVNEGCCLMRP